MYLPLKRKLPNITSKIPPIAAMAVILLGWEVVSISGIVPSYMLPSPIAVLDSPVLAICQPYFSMRNSLCWNPFYGLLIGIALAFVFATMMDRFRVMDQAFYPIMIITQTIPTIAIAPILVLWMGFWNGTEDHSGCDHHFFFQLQSDCWMDIKVWIRMPFV